MAGQSQYSDIFLSKHFKGLVEIRFFIAHLLQVICLLN
jgi:hypothetical protein